MKKTFLLASILLLVSCGTNVENEKNLKTDPIEEVKVFEQINESDIADINPEIDLISGDVVALIKTTKGNILLALETQLTPITTSNFIGLSKKDYYDGIIFHRVIDGFMIQGGDPTGTGMGGESIYGKEFEDEFSEKLSNLTYTISMANRGDNTNTSQFFINTADNSNLDYNKIPFSSKHAVFGKVVDGFDTVDAISKSKVDVTSGNKPLEDITIEDIEIFTYNDGDFVNYQFNEKEAIKLYEEKIAKDLEAKKSKELENGDKVGVHYTLTLGDGTKKDSSLDRNEVFYFTLGAGEVIPGWDTGLLGHKIGDKFNLEIAPEDGYGLAEIVSPKKDLAHFEQAGIKLEKGGVLPTYAGDIKIIDADEETITLENPSPLAGETLFFEIEVMDIK